MIGLLTTSFAVGRCLRRMAIEPIGSFDSDLRRDQPKGMSPQTEKPSEENPRLGGEVPEPFVELTDLADGTARVRLDLILAWADVLKMLDAIRLAELSTRDRLPPDR